jgi:NADH:ubiquinone oxidoreductase subunit E
MGAIRRKEETTVTTPCSCEEKRAVARIVEKHSGTRGVLVDVLHDTQTEFGYLPAPVLRALSAELRVSLAQVYGVATFYAGFRFTPPPQNVIKVCTGTACHVRGATAVLKQFENSLGIAQGETTGDDWIGLETVNCVGCCALAPALVVNGAVRRGDKPEQILAALGPPKGVDEDAA